MLLICKNPICLERPSNWKEKVIRTSLLSLQIWSLVDPGKVEFCTLKKRDENTFPNLKSQILPKFHILLKKRTLAKLELAYLNEHNTDPPHSFVVHLHSS